MTVYAWDTDWAFSIGETQQHFQYDFFQLISVKNEQPHTRSYMAHNVARNIFESTLPL